MAEGCSETEAEVKAIRESWGKVKSFLDELNNREDEGNQEVKTVIKEIRDELNQHIKKDQVVVKEEDSEKSGDSSSSNSDSYESATDSGEPSTSSGEVPAKKVRKKIKVKKEKKESSDSDDSDTSVEIRKRKITTTKKKKKDREYGDGSVMKLLSKLDNRIVPKLEIFGEDGNMELEEFLDLFEEHHKENYKGRKYFWLTELKKYLKGDLLEIYNSIRENEDEYRVVKKKLLKHYENEKFERRNRAKNKFKKAKLKESESILRYSNRLLSLFKGAYPSRSYEKSLTLITHFKNTVPKVIRSKLSNLMLHYKLKDKKMTWTKVQKFAEVLSRENSTNNVSDTEEEEVIKVNLTKTNYQPVNRYNRYNKEQDNKFEGPTSLPASKEVFEKCSFCGRFGHEIDRCRKRLGTCFICGKPGHLSRNCWHNKERKDVGRGQSASPKQRSDINRFERGISTQVFSRKLNKSDDLNCQPPAQPRNSWRK